VSDLIIGKQSSGLTVYDYLDLPYTTILKRDEEGDIIARIQELPGCTAHGASENEALERLREVQQAWIESCIEQGDSIPPPNEDAELPSGKFLQRVPRSLHLKLKRYAERENISLNQAVTAILAEAVGRKL
jgi:antitoxin HicB